MAKAKKETVAVNKEVKETKPSTKRQTTKVESKKPVVKKETKEVKSVTKKDVKPVGKAENKKEVVVVKSKVKLNKPTKVKKIETKETYRSSILEIGPGL